MTVPGAPTSAGSGCARPLSVEFVSDKSDSSPGLFDNKQAMLLFLNLVDSYSVPLGSGIRFARISLPSGVVQSNKKW